jgi:hypothetical protein
MVVRAHRHRQFFDKRRGLVEARAKFATGSAAQKNSAVIVPPLGRSE